MPFRESRLKKTRQTFDDGEVIFCEEEPSDTAFEVVSGNVEITKKGDQGGVRLAVLEPGEMFGEMEILDQGTRSATATAVGPVTVNVISRKDFLTGLRDKPDLALGIMSQMAQRLRSAGDMVAHVAPRTTTGTAQPGRRQGRRPGAPRTGACRYRCARRRPAKAAAKRRCARIIASLGDRSSSSAGLARAARTSAA